MYHSIEAAVRDYFGEGVSIAQSESVPGGDINRAYRMRLSSGECIFVKTNAIHNAGFFLAELKGLEALRSAGEIGVPHVFGAGTDEQRNVSFLAMEYIRSAPGIRTYWETFGHELAKLHRAECRPFAVSEDTAGNMDSRRTITSAPIRRTIIRKTSGLIFTENAGFCPSLPWRTDILIRL